MSFINALQKMQQQQSSKSQDEIQYQDDAVKEAPCEKEVAELRKKIDELSAKFESFTESKKVYE